MFFIFVKSSQHPCNVGIIISVWRQRKDIKWFVQGHTARGRARKVLGSEGHCGCLQSTQGERVMGTKWTEMQVQVLPRKQHHAGATDSPLPSLPFRWSLGGRGTECADAKELWTPWTRGLCFLEKPDSVRSSLSPRTAILGSQTGQLSDLSGFLLSPCWPYYLHLMSTFRKEVGRSPLLRVSHEYSSLPQPCPVLSWMRAGKGKALALKIQETVGTGEWGKCSPDVQN